MNLSTICRLFCSMTGLPMDEALRQLPLMPLAQSEIISKLRAEVKPEQHSDLLEHLAAALAFYRYSIISANTGGVQSVKTGDVTVSADPGGSVDAAAAVRDEFLQLAAPLFTDADFVFRSV